MKKLCIVRFSALGDVILCSCVVDLIARAQPDWSITWLTHPVFTTLFKDIKGIHWLNITKPQRLKDYWHTRNQLKDKHFDAALCMQASFRTNLIYPLIKADLKIGFDDKRGRDGHRLFVDQQIDYQDNHLFEGFLQFAKALEVNIDLPLRWPIHVPTGAQTWAGKRLSENTNWIAINPAASKSERTWPLEYQIQLINTIHRQTHYNVVLTGGLNPVELSLAERIQQSILNPKRLLNLVGQSSLLELAALYQRVKCLIAPDTGPIHLACALGTPVVGLYAVARPALSGPYGQAIEVIDAYPEAVEKYLRKSINEVHWHQRVHHPKVMNLIKPERVFTALTHLTQLS